MTDMQNKLLDKMPSFVVNTYKKIYTLEHFQDPKDFGPISASMGAGLLFGIPLIPCITTIVCASNSLKADAKKEKIRLTIEKDITSLLAMCEAAFPNQDPYESAKRVLSQTLILYGDKTLKIQDGDKSEFVALVSDAVSAVLKEVQSFAEKHAPSRATYTDNETVSTPRTQPKESASVEKDTPHIVLKMSQKKSRPSKKYTKH